MENKINELRPSTVSKHTANPAQLNAIDFGLNSLQADIGSDKMVELKSMLEDLESKGVIKRFLNPDNNAGEAAYHIEIINTNGETSSETGSSPSPANTPKKDEKKPPVYIDTPIVTPPLPSVTPSTSPNQVT